MCGEKLLCSLSLKPRIGSPPRVRGKALLMRLTENREGITPACAGKSVSDRWLIARAKDHPRVCGEKLRMFLTSRMYLGSPPRVRGKEYQSSGDWTTLRITPACAGKSYSQDVNEPQSQDHPRVCGEKFKILFSASSSEGSPPRVRGKGKVLEKLAVEAGITPACAGKRKPSTNTRCPKKDHPRVCGEKLERHRKYMHL